MIITKKQLLETIDKTIEFEKIYPILINTIKKDISNPDYYTYFDLYLRKYGKSIEYFKNYEDNMLHHMYGVMDNVPQDVTNQILKSKEFKKILKKSYDIDANIPEILNKFDSQGNIIIYRSMTVSKKWLQNINKVKKLGIYWAWKSGIWGPYGGDGEFDIEIVGRVNKKNINMTQTIFQNMMYGDTECEITVKENTPIEVLKIKYKAPKNKNSEKYKELKINKIFLA